MWCGGIHSKCRGQQHSSALDTTLYCIVIDKKLFVRSLKDKRRRSQDKVDLELLHTRYDKILEDLRLKLVDKLASVINGKTCQGVFNDLGDEVLVKGKKFSNKMLSNVEDYTHLTKGVWTTSDDLNAIVSIYE